MALLGALLAWAPDRGLDWEPGDIRSLLPGPDAFYLSDHRVIYKRVLGAIDGGDPIDYLSVVPHLEAGGPCDAGDWGALCIGLSESFADLANARFYARAVREAWQRRETIRALDRAVDDAHAPMVPIADTLAKVANDVDRIDQVTLADREPVPEADLLATLENPRTAKNSKAPVALGRLGFDLLGGGLDKGTLTIIGARPSCGKTSMGLTLCNHVARATDGCAALFVSLEMTAEQVAVRLLAMRSGLPVADIRSGAVNEVQFNKARNEAVLEAGRGRPILIRDGVTDIEHIGALVRRAVRKYGVGLVVVDYLGLATIRGKFDRHDLRIGAMTGALKRLAQETHTAVVALVQLNRGADDGSDRLRMKHLRDSGCIEADADCILLLQKGDQDECEKTVCDTTVYVEKHRQGDTGVAQVQYRRATMMFQAPHMQPEPDPEPEIGKFSCIGAESN
jgi:replicative DNA helicase